ncbi:MAG TPA: HAD family phosphatase [Bryobacteraceae bacterium]|jgi:putative hydrolase of the HAD superfamily
MSYKAVIFDLGKVLVQFDFKRGYRALEGLCPYAAAEIPKRIATTNLVQEFETGLVEKHDFVSQFSKLLSLDLDYDRFCAVWTCIFSETLLPESMLEGLAARYRLILLSNTNAIHFEMIQANYPLLRHFHDLVLSYEVRAMKPRPEIFQAAVDRAGCRPEECFFTDDIADNVEAARRLGIDAVQFRSAEQLEEAMRSRGISW